MTRHAPAALALLATLALPAAALARPAPVIPAEFRGLWSTTGNCARGADDSQLVLTARQASFFASEGPLLALRRLDARTIRVTLLLSGEGETARETLTFRLSADRSHLT